MSRIQLSLSAAIVACSPAPQQAAMLPSGPSPVDDLPAEALGRRILSTAFVRIGPDGHLTVGRQDGSMIVLRDVTMQAKAYCGVQVTGAVAGKRYCGGYAEVAMARPGGGPA